MRVEGKGAEGSKGHPPGDLFIQLQVAEDRDGYFKRIGFDLVVELPVPLIDAILGGSLEVRTLDGPVTLKVPPGSQPNSQLVLRGKGVRMIQTPSRR
jgi:molecular chaperone DnaJ